MLTRENYSESLEKKLFDLEDMMGAKRYEAASKFGWGSPEELTAAAYSNDLYRVISNEIIEKLSEEELKVVFEDENNKYLEAKVNDLKFLASSTNDTRNNIASKIVNFTNKGPVINLDSVVQELAQSTSTIKR